MDMQLVEHHKQLIREGWPPHALSDPVEVHPNIWISGAAFTTDIPTWCKKNRFTHVLNAAGPSVATYRTQPEDHGLRYLVVKLDDDDTGVLSHHWDKTFSFINEGVQGKILVHCMWGQSRSVSFVIHYLMKTYGVSYQDALHHVRRMRPRAQPNPYFEMELMGQ
jgi:atypical dual specificity phosphatase